VNILPFTPQSGPFPFFFYETLAYSPNFIASFEQGKFYYPIIVNPFTFGSFDYFTPLQLFKFYLQVSFCEPQYYFINVPYFYILESSTNVTEYNFIFVYRHVVVPNIPPINYLWNLYKIIYPVSTSNVNTQHMITCTLQSNIAELFKTQTMKKTNEIIPEPLLYNFCTNYSYKFGFHYGNTGSIPSNNSFFTGTNCPPTTTTTTTTTTSTTTEPITEQDLQILQDVKDIFQNLSEEEIQSLRLPVQR
jgi:hypothetical protein